MDKTVTVIGAGIVGVCCALHLQREGFRVRRIEKGEPTHVSGSASLRRMAGRLQLLFPAGVYERPTVSADTSPACVDTALSARESTLN